MLEKYEDLSKILEATCLELQAARKTLSNQQRCSDEERARFLSSEAKLHEEIEILESQVVEDEEQVATLIVQNEVLTTSTLQVYTKGKGEGLSSGVCLYKKPQEFSNELD
ncbi:hypothetical protein Salat_2903000 [Sesamum alatum]|uniref:Uncharacterized protein n=1 Tax=Sesamum alatum TaxID=300844 RepID=A0AAE1XJJ1_9LAMI|nr:hypothetical protein Salat_2903000 [Sesamum alatum]